jgi:hypothetical protein
MGKLSKYVVPALILVVGFWWWKGRGTTASAPTV